MKKQQPTIHVCRCDKRQAVFPNIRVRSISFLNTIVAYGLLCTSNQTQIISNMVILNFIPSVHQQLAVDQHRTVHDILSLTLANLLSS